MFLCSVKTNIFHRTKNTQLHKNYINNIDFKTKIEKL